MPLFSLQILVVRSTLIKVRLLGLFLFFAAQILPAYRGPLGRVLAGWQCALLPMGLFNATYPNMSVQLLMVCGMVLNFLVVLSFFLGFSEKHLGVKMLLFVAMLATMLATAVFYYTSRATPLIGYFLWLAGAVLVAFQATYLVPARASYLNLD